MSCQPDSWNARPRGPSRAAATEDEATHPIFQGFHPGSSHPIHLESRVQGRRPQAPEREGCRQCLPHRRSATPDRGGNFETLPEHREPKRRAPTAEAVPTHEPRPKRDSRSDGRGLPGVEHQPTRAPQEPKGSPKRSPCGIPARWPGTRGSIPRLLGLLGPPGAPESLEPPWKESNRSTLDRPPAPREASPAGESPGGTLWAQSAVAAQRNRT